MIAKCARSTVSLLPKDSDGGLAVIASGKSYYLLCARREELVRAEEHVKLMRGRSAFFIFVALPEGRKATLEYVNGLKSLLRIKSIPSPPLGTRVILLRRAMLLDPQGTPIFLP